MNRSYLAVAGTFIFLLQPFPALSSMHCGNDLVSLGDYSIEVLAKCGEPDYVAERVIYRVKTITEKHSHARKYAHVQKETHVPVSTETWVYNFGPNRFMQEVRFVDGRLERLRTLGRGFALSE